MSRDQSKAANYIQQLDGARCEGNWDAVPELVRKIKKHAPGRTCLTLTAEAELAVVKALHTRPTTAHPSTARPETSPSTAASQPSNLPDYIPLLSEAIQKEAQYVEDRFQAQVCLGWIYWQIGKPAQAIVNLPKEIEEEFSQVDGSNNGSAQWTKVCALRAAYIKGSAQFKTLAFLEALDTFESTLPIIPDISTTPKPGKELRILTELFLTAFCKVSSHVIRTGTSSLLETETLTAFRTWAKFWDAHSSAPTGGCAPQSDTLRRDIWKEYYIVLSDLLQQGLPFPTTALTISQVDASTNLLQRAELKRVEAKYENLLLSEIQFPKAEEPSEEVEAFVDIVIQNWRILCGNSWKEADLGEGGSEAVSRGVLDILYRAATKTFHSTALLRHLFTVHLAVAEFELAFKAFSTYMAIVKKGKARMEKTGEPEHGLDDDGTVLRTASECIKALCRYGASAEAEEAHEIAKYFEEWLEKHHPSEKINGNGGPLENNIPLEATSDVAPTVFAAAWRSIGISYAHWARVTFDASARGDLQVRAIMCLRKALSPEYQSTTDVETLFALGILLAERRELGPAIEVVRSGLLPQPSATTSERQILHAARFERERMLIPLWHLLALLLSARQDFFTAAKSCEGAFEQFKEPSNLFGGEDLKGAFRSEHLNEKHAPRNQGVVDEMDDFERENVLEVKITQLTLIEVLEGPEVAVNASDELLSLYMRLFGEPQKDSASSTGNMLVPPPKSSAGTIRSIKGSIFGRSSRSHRKSNPIGAVTEEKTGAVTRPQTTQTTASTTAPKIQVTNANGSTTKQPHHLKDHLPHHHAKPSTHGSVLRKKSAGNMKKRSSSTTRAASSPQNAHVTVVDGEKFFTPEADTDGREEWLGDDQHTPQTGPDSPHANSSKAGSASAHQSTPVKPLPQSQQTTHKGHHLNSAGGDSRMSPYSITSNPVPRFPKEQERRKRKSILVKVWLLISGFYRRASLYDDAKGAIEEAYKLVTTMEADVLSESSGNVSIDNAGWGGGKTVGELWGDVFSERASLAVAEASPYAALSNFELALTHFPDHPSAIVGLCNILLDIYTEVLLPLPTTPNFMHSGVQSTASALTLNTTTSSTTSTATLSHKNLPIGRQGPLGLPSTLPKHHKSHNPMPAASSGREPHEQNTLSPALLDRLAARDRAYGLLSTLTKLGSGWNHSEAWFALARAYEEGGQPEKAREVLWWCVELEEARAVREWSVIGGGGYVL